MYVCFVHGPWCVGVCVGVVRAGMHGSLCEKGQMRGSPRLDSPHPTLAK